MWVGEGGRERGKERGLEGRSEEVEKGKKGISVKKRGREDEERRVRRKRRGKEERYVPSFRYKNKVREGVGQANT